MSYIALYREWRPQTFADMVGQEHIKTTLQNAIRHMRFAHAYLFSGPRGTGKTSTAKIFAKAINCEHGPAVEPCNVCAACRGITEGSIMDVVEIDAASNRGIEEIRDLREQVKYAPTEVRYKVYIIDEVHMLTTEAFNALLKTLEEPPHHVLFVLATTEPHKLPATIISRCQRFDFRRIVGKDIVGRLKQIALDKQLHVEEPVFWMLARAADGGMRDALSLFDQMISFGEQVITSDSVYTLLGSIRTEVMYAMLLAIIQGDTTKALREFSDIIQSGKDPSQCIHDLLQLVRDVMMLKTVPDLQEIQERMKYDSAFAEFGNRCNVTDISYIMEQLTTLQSNLKWNSDARLLAEVTIVRLSQHQTDTKQDVWDKVRQLEHKLQALADRLQQGITAQHGTEALAFRKEAPGKELDRQSVEKISMHQIPRPVMNQSAAKSQSVSFSGTSSQLSSLGPVNHVLFKQIQGNWQQILEEVKRRKITAQAWLLDGEPVAVAGEQLLAAFKNQIHRETVMKPINKSVIDEVLSMFANTKLSLTALSQTEWKQLQGKLLTSMETTLHVQPDHDANEKSGRTQNTVETAHETSSQAKMKNEHTIQKEADWIEKTKELFGSDHVYILNEGEI